MTISVFHMKAAKPVLLPPPRRQAGLAIRAPTEQWAFSPRMPEAARSAGLEEAHLATALSTPISSADSGKSDDESLWAISDGMKKKAIALREKTKSVRKQGGGGKGKRAEGDAAVSLPFPPEEDLHTLGDFFAHDRDEDGEEDSPFPAGGGGGPPDDPLLPWDQPDPHRMRMFSSMASETARLLDERREFMGRGLHEVSHTGEPMEFSRRQLLIFLLPPPVGSTDICKLGKSCIIMQASVGTNKQGYVGRHFLEGYCYCDLLLVIEDRKDSNVRNNVVPSKPVNPFTVKVCTDEYDGRDMIPIDINGQKTGVVGHVPAFHKHKHDFLKIEPGFLAELKALGESGEVVSEWYYAEVNMDFLPASTGHATGASAS